MTARTEILKDLREAITAGATNCALALVDKLEADRTLPPIPIVDLTEGSCRALLEIGFDQGTEATLVRVFGHLGPSSSEVVKKHHLPENPYTRVRETQPVTFVHEPHCLRDGNCDCEAMCKSVREAMQVPRCQWEYHGGARCYATEHDHDNTPERYTHDFTTEKP